MLSSRFLRRCNFGYTQTEIPIDQNDFAACNDLVADNQIDGIGHVAIQFHHVAGAEFKDFS